MFNSILPCPKPNFLFLHCTIPPLFPFRNIYIKLYTFNDFIFFCVGKKFCDIVEKVVYFVGGINDNMGVS